jgi:hypothetical protein
MQEKPGLAFLFCGALLQSLDIAKYHIMKDLFVCNDGAQIGACPWLFRISRNSLPLIPWLVKTRGFSEAP